MNAVVKRTAIVAIATGLVLLSGYNYGEYRAGRAMEACAEEVAPGEWAQMWAKINDDPCLEACYAGRWAGD